MIELKVFCALKLYYLSEIGCNRIVLILVSVKSQSHVTHLCRQCSLDNMLIVRNSEENG